MVAARRRGRLFRRSQAKLAPLEKGEVVRLVTATGGGYGEPKDRPRERVLEDLKNGFILPGQARRDYGLNLAAEI
jgi:N-methylhydantoinase B